MITEGLVGHVCSFTVIYAHVQSCMVVHIALHGAGRVGWFCMLIGFLGSYLYLSVSCDIQETGKKGKMCTRFSIFNTATLVPLRKFMCQLMLPWQQFKVRGSKMTFFKTSFCHL